MNTRTARRAILASFLVALALAGMTLAGMALAAPADQTDPNAPTAPLATSSPLAPSASDNNHQLVIPGIVDQWAISDAFFYWANQSDDCIERAPAADSILMRRPYNGGATLTLDTDADCDIYDALAADETGVYYFDPGSPSRILHHIPGDPTNPVTVVTNPGSVDKIIIDGDFLYWDSGLQILRAPKTGGTAQVMASLPTSIVDFIIDRGQAYAAGFGGGIWYVENIKCGSPPCAAESITGLSASKLLAGGPGSFAGEFYAVASSTQELRRLTCFPSGSDWLCTVNALHDTPSGWVVTGLDGICKTTFPGQICLGYSDIFLTERNTGGSGSRVLRIGGTTDEIAIGDRYVEGLHLQGGYVYYAEAGTNPGLYRVAFDAPSIERDLEATHWEVTQAIQNLDNEVPLVSGKRTFVIVHAEQNFGPRAMSVEVELRGERNGQPLPGSPLLPQTAPVQLETADTLDRAAFDHSWLFELPPGWTSGGTLHLRAEVDARHAYADNSRGNNVLEGDFTFQNEDDACLFVSPVRTHPPLPSHTDPNFWETVNRFETVWPVADVDVVWVGEPIEEAQICTWGIVPYPCFGPYELDQGWELDNFPPDRDRVIGKLILRQATARAVAEFYCDGGAFGPVHSVGMVHPDSETGTSGGYANLYLHASWTKFPDHTDTPSLPLSGWPRQGGVLAQEVTHNYNRGHVDCGDPDNVDNGFPYADPCKLDDGPLDDPDTHFGFDPISRLPVRPDRTRDFMSYSNPFWVSDYTYKAVKDDILRAMDDESARTQLAKAETVIYISGFYEPDRETGGLDYAYGLDAANLDPNRLSPFFAPAWRDGRSSAHNADIIVGRLHLRNAAGAILADRSVELLPPDDHSLGAKSHFFAATFPKPGGAVASIQLLVDGEVVAEITPGVNPPQVELLEPAAGALLDQTIRIRWRATDPDGDPLLHNVHYSPDNGQTWIPQVTDYAGHPSGNEVTLELETPNTLPGSNGQALVRVTTSDGYNTTEAVSQPFGVVKRLPSVSVSRAFTATVFNAGADVVLQGAAYDAEDGTLRGSALQWQIGGSLPFSRTMATVAGLAPGSRPFSLQATDSDGNTVAISATLQIAPLSLPAASFTPALDGRCDDLAWRDADGFRLAPYDDGQATARVLRTGDRLWVCFSGLARGAANQTGTATVYLDGDQSGGRATGPGDMAFFVREDGTPGRQTAAGGSWQAASLAGFEAEIAANEENVWSAELSIPQALVEGWGGAVGLMFRHNAVETGGDSYAWPYDAGPTDPGEWAMSVLDEQPRLDGVSPQTAVTGDSTLELGLTGRQFAEGAVARWDGVPLPTVVVSATHISAMVSANLLDAAGAFPVTVANPALPGFPSEAREVVVRHPVPLLSGLTPETVQAGSDPFTLVVKGSGFVPGAVVYWDGVARSTAYISSGELRAEIRAADLGAGGKVAVTVRNPAPAEGQSAPLFFTLTPGKVERKTHLPVVVGGP